jgi:hypothetical protein
MQIAGPLQTPKHNFPCLKRMNTSSLIALITSSPAFGRQPRPARWFLLCPVILALCCADAYARDVSALSGLDSFNLLVDELSAGSTECGLDEQIIRRSIEHPLANSRLKITTSDSGPTLNVNVTTAYATDSALCSSSVQLLLSVTQSLSMADTHNEAVVMLWHDGTLIVSGKRHHREQVASALEEMAKNLRVDWIDQP